MALDSAIVESSRWPGSIEIMRHMGAEGLPELVRLRRQVWEQETGLLREEDLIGVNDHQGVHFLVNEGGRLIASTCAVEAERSDFAAHSGLPEAVLRDTMLSTRSTVHPDHRGGGLFSLLVYLAAREGRMRGRRWMAGYLEPGDVPGRKVTEAKDLANVPRRRVTGRDGDYEVVATAEEIDYVMSNCFRRIPKEVLPYLREHFFVEEAIAEVEAGARRFYAGPWYRAAEEGTLTRRQYLTTLAEIHAYVRWTTRLLGTVIGITEDADLRRHYFLHLGGELDHEVSLEHDMAHLGFDVEYVKGRRSPSDHIRAFMSLQEALCFGPRRDPSLFLAIPLSAESPTAFAPRDLPQRLARTIAGWGVEAPDRAMTFITTHIDFDGGAEGHWEATRRILHRHIEGEDELREFLSIVRLAQSSQFGAFSSIVERPDIFAAPPGA